MPGHPDGQNYAIWRGPDFFANATVHIDSTHPVGVSGQVTNYASLHLNCVASTVPGVTVNVQWWLDIGLTINLFNQTWIVPVTYALNIILPNMGNFVTLSVTTTSVAGGQCQLSCYPTNVQVPGPTHQTTNFTIGATSVSVGAGGAVSVPFQAILAGTYHLWARDITSSGKLSFFVNTVDVNAVSQFGVVSLVAPVTQNVADFAFDAVPLLLTISNSDAVPHSAGYTMSCLAKAA